MTRPGKNHFTCRPKAWKDELVTVPGDRCSRELQLQNNVAFFEQLASIQTKARRELRQAQTSASRAVEADRRSRDLKKQIVEVLSCSRCPVNSAVTLCAGFFWTSKKIQGRKNSSRKKNSSKFSKSSSKSFKNSIICQLKTDFLLKKVLKLIYFAQKFAQT